MVQAPFPQSCSPRFWIRLRLKSRFLLVTSPCLMVSHILLLVKYCFFLFNSRSAQSLFRQPLFRQPCRATAMIRCIVLGRDAAVVLFQCCFSADMLWITCACMNLKSTCVYIYNYTNIHIIAIRKNIYIYDYKCIRLPVVPHKAVAEVSKIGNL